VQVELENNKVWLQSQHGGNGGRKNRLLLLESNENREKAKYLLRQKIAYVKIV